MGFIPSPPPTASVEVDELEDLDNDSDSDWTDGEDEYSDDHASDLNDATNGAEDSGQTDPASSSTTPSALPNDTASTCDSSPWYAGLNSQGRVFGRLVDLYIFAARYDALGIRQATILTLQRCINGLETLPCPTVLKRALDSLEIEVPLCRYLIVCYGSYADYEAMSKERCATLSSQFLLDVLDISYARLAYDSVPDVGEDWCNFHEHERGEQDECEGRREKDADVLEKRKPPPRPVRRFGGCCQTSPMESCINEVMEVFLWVVAHEILLLAASQS